MKKTSYTLSELANFIGATLKGEAQKRITSLQTLKKAKDGDLSFLANPVYSCYLDSTQAGAVIMAPELAEFYTGNALLLDNPYLGYAKVSHLFSPVKALPAGVHSSATVSPTADIHPTAAIGPHVVVEDDVEIAEGVIVDRWCCHWT